MRFFRFIASNLLFFSLAALSPTISNHASLLNGSPFSYLTGGRARLTSTTGPADFSSATAKISPAVVTIFGRSIVTISPPAQQFENVTVSTLSASGSREFIKTTTGTGFFVNPDGYILTNKHVVADENATYEVILSSGKKRIAQVTYRDPNNDLAVVHIAGNGYPVATLGDSSTIKSGQSVVAYGNSYARRTTDVTSTGTVEATNRTIMSEGDEAQQLRHLIQINAQLYPGDSGGPLLNARGEVIAIDVAAAVDRDNLSFSIPINDAKRIVASAGKNNISFAR